MLQQLEPRRFKTGVREIGVRPAIESTACAAALLALLSMVVFADGVVSDDQLTLTLMRIPVSLRPLALELVSVGGGAGVRLIELERRVARQLVADPCFQSQRRHLEDLHRMDHARSQLHPLVDA